MTPPPRCGDSVASIAGDRRASMGIFRPGTRIRFWTPRFTNRSDVDPPGLLRLVAAISFVSMVAVLVHSVFIGVTGVSLPSIDPKTGLTITLLHFVIPFAMFFSVTTNSPLSRPLVGLYASGLGYAIATRKGILKLCRRLVWSGWSVQLFWS